MVKRYEASGTILDAFLGYDINNALVHFNGEILKFCLSADEESGEVSWLNPPDRRVRKAKGVVRIEWADHDA